MKRFPWKVKSLISIFTSFDIHQVPRLENLMANILSNLATSAPGDLPRESFEVIKKPSLEESTPMLQVNNKPSWMDPFVYFLRDGTLPLNPKEAQKIRHQAPRYILYEGNLYKMSFSLPLLNYLHSFKAESALWKVHEEICGNHLERKSLAYKVLRQRYY